MTFPFSQVTQLLVVGGTARTAYIENGGRHVSGWPNTSTHGCPLVAGCTQGCESRPSRTAKIAFTNENYSKDLPVCGADAPLNIFSSSLNTDAFLGVPVHPSYPSTVLINQS